jgi:hypothetical protein
MPEPQSALQHVRYGACMNMCHVSQALIAIVTGQMCVLACEAGMLASWYGGTCCIC